MIYPREEHINFLEEELRAQTEAFDQKLNALASYLLHVKNELFVAQFLTFESGMMILKFSNHRSLPRKGEYLYCFTVPKKLRNHRSWGNMTYKDLLKERNNFTETVCIWQNSAKDKEGKIDPNFSIVGFRGVDPEFAYNISKGKNMILLLGPTVPPYKYLASLQQVVRNDQYDVVNELLDHNFQYRNWTPALLKDKDNISSFILNQLELRDTLILIGPPGTGKTHLISEICAKLCQKGKSILITSLSNRSLIEVAQKPALKNLLDEEKVYKTNISVDEANETPQLQPIKSLTPIPGSVIVSTFYITCSEAAEMENSNYFDYVIVDEASQALLATFAVTKLLGKKNIWIGDNKQLSPIVEINEKKIKKKNYNFLIFGLESLINTSTFPVYQLSNTYRLTDRTAKFTSLFYHQSLRSKAKNVTPLTLDTLPPLLRKLLHPAGGPTLIKMNLETGSKQPKNAIDLATLIVKHLTNIPEKPHISVISQFVSTVKSLQTSIYRHQQISKNLLIDTVDRVQGLTSDITLFIIPKTGYSFSLNPQRFNVATSRAKKHILILADQDITQSFQGLNEEVFAYLQQLDDDFSFTINHNQILLK